MGSSKLKFKGEKTSKKRKHKSVDDGTQAESPGENATAASTSMEGWVDVANISQAAGPVYITHAETSDMPATCMAINQTLNNKIFPHILNGKDEDAEQPTDINHVFVCTLLPDSDSKYSLRSSNGRFLAIDATGVVSAPTEARGPQEEFQLVAHPSIPNAFAFQSCYYQKYLSIDLVAGGKFEYRGDSTTIGPEEAFRIRMQAKFQGENEKRFQTERQTKVNDGLVIIKDIKGAENDAIRQYQARGAGRLVSSRDSSSELKKARKEGTVAETMLDRRMKLKHDRYC